MAIKLYHQPKLEKPDLLASWSGIGNIGVIAADTLRTQLLADELGEIEPWDFFYPRKVTIRDGVLDDLEFPRNKFYYKRLGGRDLIFFIGDEQPAEGGGLYAEGRKAYQMANMVLDVAEKFGCGRIYTSGAAVTVTHHEIRPRVWVVTTRSELSQQAKGHANTVLMNEVEGAGDWGSVTGLNGLLLGLAKTRGFEGICLMGEIPDYLARAPFPYPRASKSVLEVLASFLGMDIDYGALDEMVLRIDGVIDDVYQRLSEEIRERMEKRKQGILARPETISDADENWIKEHIDEFFQKGVGGDERPS